MRVIVVSRGQHNGFGQRCWVLGLEDARPAVTSLRADGQGVYSEGIVLGAAYSHKHSIHSELHHECGIGGCGDPSG